MSGDRVMGHRSIGLGFKVDLDFGSSRVYVLERGNFE